MPDRMTRQWAHAFVSTGVSTGTGGDRLVDILANYKTEIGVNTLRGKTVAAIIGEVTVKADTLITDVNELLTRAAIAFLVAQEGLLAVNAPVPGNDSYPYMSFYPLVYHQLAQEVAAGIFRNIPFRIPVHIRSMRKLRINEALIFKAHNFAGFSVSFGFEGNVLLLG